MDTDKSVVMAWGKGDGTGRKGAKGGNGDIFGIVSTTKIKKKNGSIQLNDGKEYKRLDLSLSLPLSLSLSLSLSLWGFVR